jgi:SAM-dependent methyltransferase
MNLTLSNHLPALYHGHHIHHLEDLSFWLALAQAQGEPVLELGCGTGRILVHLAQAGYRTFGLDNSLSMLSYLQKILPGGLEPHPLIFQSDMSTFRLAAHFPLIVLPCNTYSTLSKQARKKTIENVVLHLKKRGCFSFSVPNPEILVQMPAQGETEVEEIFVHPSDGEPVQVSSAWERTSEMFILCWHYDHLLPNGKVYRHTMEVSHWILSIQTYVEEIQAAGLIIDKLYGDFDYSPYKNQSPSFILKATLP